MKIMAWDQSTKISAWSIFIDGDYAESGVIDHHKIKDVNERVRQMGLSICVKIEEVMPSVLIIEEVAQQSNANTLKLLARIQGIIIGFAAAHKIPVYILEPTKWRSSLEFKQGAGVKREELKGQAIAYIKDTYGLDLAEDICESICINTAAHKIYDFEWDLLI